MPDNNQENTPEVIPRMQYEQINWEDAPSIATPLSAENLNKMDTALAALYDDVAIIWNKVSGIDGNIVDTINGKADKESPIFTGTPTAPTPDYGDDSAQIATTEFVENGFRPLWVDMGTISVLPVHKDVTEITDDMICTAYEVGIPSAKRGDWVVTTGDGYVDVNGVISGTTTLKIRLEKVISA